MRAGVRELTGKLVACALGFFFSGSVVGLFVALMKRCRVVKRVSA